MSGGAARPRGRRPGRDDTRGTIAASAEELFARDGYDRTSLRAIARHADVDPALVHHYFESKAQLFVTVVIGSDTDFTRQVVNATSGERASVGTRLAKAILRLGEESGLAPYVLDDNADGESIKRTKLMCEFWAREVFGRIAASFGHRNDALRGQLAAATVFGLLSARHLGALGAIAAASNRSLIEPLGRVLQDYLVEDW